ncbi:MAG: FCD domain-containing protein [Galbitalea sp.]
MQSGESRERVHREHAAIAAAILAGDTASAELATIEHLRGTGKRLVDSVSANGQRLRAGGLVVR